MQDFNLYRSETDNGEYAKINGSLIPAEGSSTQGTAYEFVDTGVQNGKTYYYKLESINLSGILRTVWSNERNTQFINKHYNHYSAFNYNHRTNLYHYHYNTIRPLCCGGNLWGKRRGNRTAEEVSG